MKTFLFWNLNKRQNLTTSIAALAEHHQVDVFIPGSINILLAVTHLVDKQHWDEESQNIECTVVADSIEEAEESVEHSRTILVGDFNMNPFQAGVVNARGLHAVMTKRIALEGFRVNI